MERALAVPVGELSRRLLVAAVGIPLAILVVWQGGWYLGLVMGGVAGVGAREFFDLAATRAGRPLWIPGVAVAAALPLAAVLFPSFGALSPWAFGGVVLLTVLALGASVWTRGVEGSPLSAASATVAGAVYTGGTLAFALLLRHLPDAVGAGPGAVHGGYLVAFPITVTWIGDSAAYFAGKRWGKRKLVPRISPGKTVVGGLAGLVASTLSAALFALLFLDPTRPFGVGIAAASVIGALLGVGAQLGDLTESVLKREAGVKDSGEILPGHGGVLDRFDALFFTIPLCYLLLALYVRP